jgi:hypothetical protein
METGLTLALPPVWPFVAAPLSRQSVPQGGVISPLLSNVYLVSPTLKHSDMNLFEFASSIKE